MLKKRNIGRRGQATVEYLMFIVVIASIVAGLASYSSSIESKFEAAKVGLRNKLAGDYKIQRSDFFSSKINTTGAGANNGTAGKSGGGPGAGTQGGKTPVVQGGEGNKPAGIENGNAGTAETQGQESPASKDRQERLQQEREAREESDRAAREYKNAQQTEEDAYKEQEKQAISERQLAMASAAEREAILRKAHDQGIYTDKERAFEERKWSIGKLLIIIIVVVIFLIIILKSRQGRD